MLAEVGTLKQGIAMRQLCLGSASQQRLAIKGILLKKKQKTKKKIPNSSYILIFNHHSTKHTMATNIALLIFGLAWFLSLKLGKHWKG